MNGIRHIEFVALPETLEEFKALPQAEMTAQHISSGQRALLFHAQHLKGSQTAQ